MVDSNSSLYLQHHRKLLSMMGSFNDRDYSFVWFKDINKVNLRSLKCHRTKREVCTQSKANA